MTNVRNILVPTDFSETSDVALRHAVDAARTYRARLYLLHVPGKTGEDFEADFPIGRFETTVRDRLAAFLSEEEIAALRPEYALRIGTPAEEIVHYAQDREIDLIVMGTHGRRGVAHLLLGSVAEHVVRTAPCPVLLVRQQEHTVAERREEAAHEVASVSKPRSVAIL
jgi:nucleotide-binding universal stress UspA family protein